ncbi:MAG: tRNA (N(6)-L-threonylcarbamoyladenosine(37)-C(2))-methylthiotransferase MtaB [Planctomycetota bacterium]|jgi:threonylcarbamoyladenosine tRNA methylthiotransferase MtaB
MKTFSINTLGCKVNQYESQQIRELLEQLGLNQVDPAPIKHRLTSQRCGTKKPDLVVINTCCVTHTASAKSRQYIRKAQKLSPDAVIVVSGCLPTVNIGELNASGKNVHLIRYRNTLSATLNQIVNGEAAPAASQSLQACEYTIIKTENGRKIKYKNKSSNQPKLPQLTCFRGHTRAFLKVQDGCDGCCSYCIIPKTRPVVQSKPAEAVLQEAQGLVEAGHKEIVVTGVFLGAYGQRSVRRKNWGQSQNDKLANLLDKMAEIPNLARIRLSSLEPADVTPRLLDTFSKRRNIMPHLHLSLQSGSNAVLKKMCRQYRAEEFRDTIELIKSRLDRPAITADIIVGFPGETEADFEQTVDLAKEAGFAKMHIFSFSPRQGTAAAAMQDTVDNRVIKTRAQILRELEIELGLNYRQQFIGETAAILVENSNGQTCGRSERYFMVYLEKTGKKLKRNELVRVKLVENNENGVIGQAEM